MILLGLSEALKLRSSRIFHIHKCIERVRFSAAVIPMEGTKALKQFESRFLQLTFLKG